MKSQKISSGIIFVVLFLNITVAVPANAIECELIPQTAYKSKTSPAVYYITRSCTKRPFVNEVSFFAYFSSWKDVKIVADKIFAKIPDDARGAMRIVGETQKNQTKSVEKINLLPEEKSKTATEPQSETKEKIIETKKEIAIETKSIAPNIVPPTANLIQDFLHCPTESERAQSQQNFSILWGSDWDAYPFSCDYKTTKPTRLPIYATLRLLKNISFTKPLPFTHGSGLYEYLTTKKLKLIPLQNCATYSTGWNYTINLGGTFAHTHAVKSGSATCEPSIGSGADILDGYVYNPIYKAATLVHEAHHAIEGSVHNGKNGGDKDINDNSAWAAQFYFYAWINLYSENIDVATKLLAKNAAADILNNRFLENKCPTDPELKIAVNTIVPNICK